MTSLRSGAVLCLLLICVSAAPAERDDTKDDQGEAAVTLEDQMVPGGNEEIPNTTFLEMDQTDSMSDDSSSSSDTSSDLEDEQVEEEEKEEKEKEDGDEEEEPNEEDGTNDYPDYGSLPSWYVQELLGNENDNQSQVDSYRRYKTELDELILDVKLYQVYHSIKTLKHVLDDLIEEERREAELMRQEAENESRDEQMGGVEPEEAEEPPVSLFTKQLGALKNKPRRVKRDLSWGDGIPNFGKSSWNNGKPDPRFMVKYDDDDHGNDVGDNGYDVTQGDLDGQFALTKKQIQDLIDTFLDAGYSPYYKNDVNINLGDQRMFQEVINPQKRESLREKNYREFIARLPTLEGLRKRDRRMHYRRSFHKRGYPDAYSDDLPASPPDDKTLLRYQIGKLARKLAANNHQQRSDITDGTEIKDFTNGPGGDVNMWFENNPRYNIGIDDNIGDTFGIMELDSLPRASPNEIGALFNNRNEYRRSPLRKRRIVQVPSLPGPYQGYFMEGQLWHQLFNKRSSPEQQEFKPKTLKIGGPNAWGNFIFIGDEGGDLTPEKAGKWFAQSFGDDIGNKVEQADPPTQIEMEGMWLDGDENGDTQSELTEEEKAWIRQILGYDD